MEKSKKGTTSQKKIDTSSAPVSDEGKKGAICQAKKPNTMGYQDKSLQPTQKELEDRAYRKKLRTHFMQAEESYNARRRQRGF